MLKTNHKNAATLYLAFILAVALNFVPSIAAQTIGGVLFLMAFIMTYVLKYSTEKDTIDFAHYNYLTKTIWIFSFFTLIAIILSTMLADNTVINEMTTNIQSGVILTEEQMMEKNDDLYAR